MSDDLAARAVQKLQTTSTKSLQRNLPPGVAPTFYETYPLARLLGEAAPELIALIEAVATRGFGKGQVLDDACDALCRVIVGEKKEKANG